MKIILLCLWGLIMNTYAQSSSSIEIYYSRIDENYSGWKMWVWNKTDNLEGFEIMPERITENGLLFILDTDKYKLNGKEIGLLPKYGNWEDKEAFDRIFKHTGQKQIYIFEGDPKVYESLNDIEKSTRIISAYYDGEYIRLVVNRRVLAEKLGDFFIKCGEITHKLEKKIDKRRINVIYLKSPQFIDLEKIRNSLCRVSSPYGEVPVGFGNAIYKVLPPADKMGEIFEDSQIKFRVFSTAKELNLIIKKDLESAELKIPFNYKGNFIWEVSVSTSYYGWLYRYEVIHHNKTYTAIDPYARLTMYNNTWAKIYKDNFKVTPLPSSQTNIMRNVIYEMSIRDITSDPLSGIKNRGKYLGLTEENVSHIEFPDIKTGISHLVELGVSAVHIMPFYDFEKDENSDTYDWGYMPVSFNSPDGWFAVNKEEKIKEAKMMIDSLHKNGIKVIMDVVYNHTAETKDKVYNFNALAPDYYYRTKEDGSYYNGSGCGNEFKSESPFGRRFIIDSLKYWIEEYSIDGFRFDLMGLIDLETVDEIIKELKKIKPDIIIYGEPWHAGGTPINGVKKGTQKGKGYAVFNDDIRDAIKGSVFNIRDLGYVQSARYKDKIITGLKGSIDTFTESPSETINYVSCHDNHTLFDRLKLSMPDDDIHTTLSRLKLAQAIAAISQGIYFLHSGEEFVRTKKGNENSYNAGDEINMIEWTNKKKYYKLFKYHRDLIKLKKEHPAFSLESADYVRKKIKFFEELSIKLPDPQSIAYLIKSNDTDSWGDVIVLINPHNKKLKFSLPEGSWFLKFDENGISQKNIRVQKFLEASPLSVTILGSR